MDISILYMGSQGSLGWDTLGWDTLGGPMGPWDRWDLGTDGTWASRTPDTSSEDSSSELFIGTRPGPAQPAQPASPDRNRLIKEIPKIARATPLIKRKCR